MPTPLITLSTDFGEGSAYVAMLKGVLLAHCPGAQLLDLSHSLPVDDPFSAALLLRRTYSYYPAGTVHLLGVDRGIGPSHALLATTAGQYFVAMDQGGLGLVLEAALENPPAEPGAGVWAVELAPRTPFMARDYLAPLAANLAQHTPPSKLGTPVTDWQRLHLHRPRPSPDGRTVEGQVLYVDRFGNLLTNLTPDLLSAPAHLRIGDVQVSRWCRSFADPTDGELCLLWGAEGWLEVVLPQGSAAKRLGAKAGDAVFLG